MRATRAVGEACGRVTGYEPESCPWRAYSDPLVQCVVSDQWATEVGGLGLALGGDPPAVLYDAHAVWRRSLDATWADERARQRERMAAERAAREALRGRG